MTTTISSANALSFTTNVELLSQQLISKIEDTCEAKDFVGEGAQDVQQVGSLALDQVVTVDGDTNYGSPSHTSRWLYPVAYDKAFLIDKVSEMLTIADFKSPYVRTLAAAAYRQVDDTFLAGYYASAATGKQGGTAATFASESTEIAATVGAAASTGMNPEKVLKALEALRLNEAIDDSGTDPIYCVIGPKQQTDLLRFVEVASGDFVAQKAYASGTIPPGWMGVNWRISNRLPTSSGTVKRIPLYVKSGMCLGFWQRPSPELFRDTSKKNNWAAQMKLMVGATRREGVKCASILCDEA